MIAKVHIKDGSDFESEIADLSGNSVILRTEHDVPFRTPMTIEMFGIVVKGEAVYVSENEPRGIGVAFETSSEEKNKLEEEAKRLLAEMQTESEPEDTSAALDNDIFAAALKGASTSPRPSNSVLSNTAFSDALRHGGALSSNLGVPTPAVATPSMSEGLAALVAQFEKSVGVNPAGEGRIFELAADGRLELDGLLEAAGIFLSLLSDRPIIAKGSPESATLVYRSIELVCKVQNLSDNRSLIHSPDKEILNKICSSFGSSLFDVIEDHLEDDAEPPVEEVPILGADGAAVKFQSFKHFVVQYVANISKGALVVAGPSFSPGTKKALVLTVPGVAERVNIVGRASFQGDGTMGYMLEDITLVQNQLAEIAARSPPSKQAQRKAARQGNGSQSTASNIDYRGFLGTMESLEDIFDFQERRPQDIQGCKGWMARCFDFLFENGVHGVFILSHEDRKIELWIHDGAVVFTRVTPDTEQDKLGRMLVIQKKTSRSALQTALKKSEDLGQPIGRTLVGMGELDNSALNSAVRYQTMKRIFEAREWKKGKIEIGPWIDPPIRTGLVITSGKSILVNLIREEIRRQTLPDLEAFAEPYLDRVFMVDLEKQDPSFGLKKKERRFFEKSAGAAVDLRDLPNATAVTVNEAYRYVLLGRALGLMVVGRAAHKKTESEKNEEILSGLKDKIANMTSGNEFEVLGLHWTCIDREIEPAYKKKKREFVALKESSHAQVRVLSGRAIEMLDKAHERLTSPGKRKKYRDDKISENERKQAATNMLDQVQLLLVKDDVVQAQVLLKTAQEVYPSSRGERLYSDIRDGSYKVDL